MLVDINQFKRINAQWGHRVGDKVLVSIVDIIQQSIRPDDILARLEGEVFGLLFTELNSAQAKIIAERMRKNVELLTGFSNRYDVYRARVVKTIYVRANTIRTVNAPVYGCSLFPSYGRQSRRVSSARRLTFWR